MARGADAHLQDSPEAITIRSPPSTVTSLFAARRGGIRRLAAAPRLSLIACRWSVLTAVVVDGRTASDLLRR